MANHIKEEERQRRIKMVEDGYTAKEIAEATGRAIPTIHMWLRKEGLKSKRIHPGRHAEAVDLREYRRMKAYNKYLTDPECARDVGISLQAWTKWRNKKGLPLRLWAKRGRPADRYIDTTTDTEKSIIRVFMQDLLHYSDRYGEKVKTNQITDFINEWAAMYGEPEYRRELYG